MFIFKQRPWAFGLFFYLSAPLFANSLQNLSERILAENLLLQQKNLEIEQANQKIHQVGVLPNPVLTFTWFGEEVQTKVGPQEQTFGIQQKIPWPMKLFQEKRVQESQRQIEVHKKEKATAQMLFLLRSKWGQLQSVYRILDIDLQVQKLFQRSLANNLRVLEAGESSVTNYFEIQTDLEILEEEIIEKELEIQSLQAEIHALIPSVEEADLGREVLFQEMALKSGSDPIALGFRESPELKIAAAEKTKWGHLKSLGKANYFPDLSVGFTYIQTGESPGMEGSGTDPWALSFGMSLPFNFNQNQGRVEESRMGQERAKLNDQEIQLRLGSEMKSAIIELRNAERKMQLFGETLMTRNRQNQELFKKNFQAMKGSFEDLLALQRRELELRKKVEKSLYQTFFQKAKILYLMGDQKAEFSFPYQSTKEPNTETKGENK